MEGNMFRVTMASASKIYNFARDYDIVGREFVTLNVSLLTIP